MDKKPKVGDKGHYSCGSDSYPITVTKVSKSGHKVTVRTVDYDADLDNGHDYYGTQVWKFDDNGKGLDFVFHWTPSRNAWMDSTARLHLTGKWYARKDPDF